MKIYAHSGYQNIKKICSSTYDDVKISEDRRNRKVKECIDFSKEMTKICKILNIFTVSFFDKVFYLCGKNGLIVYL